MSEKRPSHSKEKSRQRQVTVLSAILAAEVIVILVVIFAFLPSRRNDAGQASTAAAQSGEETASGTQSSQEQESSQAPAESSASQTSAEGSSSAETSESAAESTESSAESTESSAESTESSAPSSESSVPSSESSADSSENSSQNSSQNSSASKPDTGAHTGTLPYETQALSLSDSDLSQGSLILINKEHIYDFPDVSMISLYEIKDGSYAVANTEVVMQTEAAYAYDSFLRGYYNATGDDNLLVLNGYRSAEEAQALFDESASKYGVAHAESVIMKPGYSEHHSGLSSDLGYLTTWNFLYPDTTSNYAWLIENAHAYGFILRYPEDKTDITQISYESWHFRYVGKAAATDMYASGMCLEEWEEDIKNYSASSPKVLSVDGQTVYMYYTEGTTVPVPVGVTYEISGNNVDGFIVTIYAGN